MSPGKRDLLEMLTVGIFVGAAARQLPLVGPLVMIAAFSLWLVVFAPADIRLIVRSFRRSKSTREDS